MKRYLITRARRGIGRAIATELAGALVNALSCPTEVAVENIDLLNPAGRL